MGTTHSRRAFTLIEILLVVVLIGLLLAIAAPNLVLARERARAATCVGNLKALDAAKEQYAMDNHLADGASIRTRNLLNNYIKNPTFSRNFVCPSSGLRYSGAIGPVGTPPQCPTVEMRTGTFPHALP